MKDKDVLDYNKISEQLWAKHKKITPVTDQMSGWLSEWAREGHIGS